MKLPRWLLAATALATHTALAATIVIEPDDFAPGTDLSAISPHVTLSTTGGAPVYAASVHQGSALAANGHDTGPLGSQVFSRHQDGNSEWYYWPDMYGADTYSYSEGDPLNDPDGLMLTFSAPVSSFSLSFAELFGDAGCCGSDPVAVYIYDKNDQLMDFRWGDSGPAIALGNEDDWEDAWPYWQFSYSAPGNLIGRVLVGGESEPTTIDRLSFSFSEEVDEPMPMALLALSLAALSVARRRKAS